MINLLKDQININESILHANMKQVHFTERNMETKQVKMLQRYLENEQLVKRQVANITNKVQRESQESLICSSGNIYRQKFENLSKVDDRLQRQPWMQNLRYYQEKMTK